MGKIEELENKITAMHDRICVLEEQMREAFKRKRRAVNKYKGLEKLVAEAIENKDHVLLDLDMIWSWELAVVLQTVYPYHEFFNFEMTDPKHRRRVSRAMGALLSSMGCYENRHTTVYVPAGETESGRPSRRNRPIWIIRNFEKYKHVKATELYRIAEQQWSDALKVYHEKLADMEKVEKAIEVIETPSFM